MPMVEEASVLRVACERIGRLVTAPRHLVFESAGAVSRLFVFFCAAHTLDTVPHNDGVGNRLEI